MTAALALLAAFAGDPSRTATGAALVVFGLGFGMVGQVLTVIVQNGVERRRLGTAMATTNFFRALGGAAGAAVLGAVFASQGGVVPGVRLVFAIAAPLALLALALVWRLQEAKLGEDAPRPQGEGGSPEGRPAEQPAPSRPAIGAVR
jgi:MFS family permease